MSNSVNIQRNMVSFDKSEQFDSFSKVVIIVSDEIEYSAGTETGRTLTLNCPWGTQEIANNILQSIKGFQYQPMSASGALVDPSAEIGDGISANGVYSGIYSLDTKFNSNLPMDVSAQADEEIDEEYKYIPKSERKVTRKILDINSELRIQDGKISAEVEERKSDTKSIRATLEVQADQITAKVNKNDGSSSTFGWALETASWRIFSGTNTVLKADKNGLEVKGVIRATSGEIGGFKITSNSLTYNNQTWGGTNTNGIYIGPNGIQLGKNFKVDAAGNLTAASGTFTGSVNAGNIRYGGNYGTFNGGGISSGSISGNRLVGGTITTAYTSGGINTSLGYADFANGVFNGWNKPSWIKANQMTLGSYNMGWTTINYVDHSGNKRSVRVCVGQ